MGCFMVRTRTLRSAVSRFLGENAALKRTIEVAVAALALAGCAGTAGLGVPVRADGGILVDDKGMTVYTFDRDPVGKSVCTGRCAVNWPPIEAAAGAKAVGAYTVITRDGGGAQWAYKGKPLYRWSKDAQPGDRSGHGVDNLWRVARP